MAQDDTLVRTLLIVVAVIVLLPFLMMALAVPMMGMWGGGMMGGGMWGGGMDGGMWDGGTTGGTWFGWLFAWLLPLVIVVGAGYLLYRVISGDGEREADPAMEELRSAYARGELSEEEFDQRRERLREDR